MDSAHGHFVTRMASGPSTGQIIGPEHSGVHKQLGSAFSLAVAEFLDVRRNVDRADSRNRGHAMGLQLGADIRPPNI